MQSIGDLSTLTQTADVAITYVEKRITNHCIQLADVNQIDSVFSWISRNNSAVNHTIVRLCVSFDVDGGN